MKYTSGWAVCRRPLLPPVFHSLDTQGIEFNDRTGLRPLAANIVFKDITQVFHYFVPELHAHSNT